MDNYSISSFPDQKTERSSRIELKGELSIQHIQNIKARLEEAFKDFDHIELLIKDVSIIDLTALQYLISLKKSEVAINKSFKIEFKMNEDLSNLLKHSGFNNTEILKA